MNIGPRGEYSSNTVWGKISRECQPYSTKVNYSEISDCNWGNVTPEESKNMFFSNDCKPNVQYTSKLKNPGGLKFDRYSYSSQTSDGNKMYGYGPGWREYTETGKYYLW